jgi:CelD/BcsL family acetyltransferase involved in cellulose biosynthesis
MGTWLVASVAAQDRPQEKAPAKAAAKAQAAAQDSPKAQPQGDAQAKKPEAAQNKPQPQAEGPSQEKPMTAEEAMQAAKAAAQPHKQIDPSLVPPSITNFETEDHGSVYPSPMYLRRFAHADMAAHMPQTQATTTMQYRGDPLILLHEQLMRRQQEEAARLAAKTETDYNAPKTAPTTGTAASKPAPAQFKAKPAAKPAAK